MMTDQNRIDDALRTIDQTFHSAEGMEYLGEDVTMIQHQLQAAALASGCSDALVVAALLHDIGHLIGRQEGEPSANDALMHDPDSPLAAESLLQNHNEIK